MNSEKKMALGGK